MAKFFLSILIFILAAARCEAHANNISDEYHRLRNVDNKTLVNKAMKLIERNKQDSALVYFYAVANRYYTGKYSKADLPDIIKAIQDIAIIYMTYEYDYQKSYDNLLEAKELAESNNLERCLPNIYNSIANILQVSKQDGDKEENAVVVKMLKKSFYTALKTKQYNIMHLAMSNLIAAGMWNKRSGVNIDKELAIYKRTCAKLQNDPQAKSTVQLGKAYQAYKRGDSKTAVSIIEKECETHGSYPLAYRAQLSKIGLITAIYTNTEQYEKAIESVLRLLEIAKQHNSLDYETSLYKDLADLYKEKGDKANSQKYELLYYRAKEKLTSDGKLSSVKNVKFMRELNKANEQVMQLSEKRRTQNIILCCVILVAAIITALLYRIYRANRKIKQNNNHLYRSNVELLAKETQAREQRILSETIIQQLREENKTLKAKAHASDAPSEEQPATNASAKGTATAAESTQRQKYQGSRMTGEDTKELYAAVINIMETSSEIFRLGFSIDSLAELVHSRSRYVSQAINQESGSNFNTLLNEYRIKEACRRLSGNPDYANMTIEAIAESVGFKSRTSFGALFKTLIGLSPSAYQKMANIELRGKREE